MLRADACDSPDRRKVYMAALRTLFEHVVKVRLVVLESLAFFGACFDQHVRRKQCKAKLQQSES